VFQSLGQDTERQRLRFSNGFLACLTVNEDARKFSNFSNPAPVGLLFNFNRVHEWHCTAQTASMLVVLESDQTCTIQPK